MRLESPFGLKLSATREFCMNISIFMKLRKVQNSPTTQRGYYIGVYTVKEMGQTVNLSA